MAAQPNSEEVRDRRREHKRLRPFTDELVGDRDPTDPAHSERRVRPSWSVLAGYGGEPNVMPGDR
jgi:hypothetical protein